MHQGADNIHYCTHRSN